MASKSCLKDADNELREELLQQLVDVHLMSPYLQVGFNSDPSRLPLRELPHGSWSELYLLYQSFSRVKNEAPACRATFFQAVGVWKICLRFHKKTQHAQCATCARLRSQLHGATESWLQCSYFIISTWCHYTWEINIWYYSMLYTLEGECL